MAELWGAETRKAVDNFPVSGERIPPAVVHWLGRIKGAAARVNAACSNSRAARPSSSSNSPSRTWTGSTWLAPRALAQRGDDARARETAGVNSGSMRSFAGGSQD